MHQVNAPVANADPAERDLVEKIARGDEEAFERIVLNYESRLLAFMTKVSGDPNVAREVAQEAFVKVFFKADSFNYRCSFFTWLCEIAVRKFFDWRKQRMRWLRKHALVDFSARPDQKDSHPGPSENATRHELAEIVREGIAKLSPDHQTVIMLREFQNASYEEIAAAMNCSIGTVESRLFRARRKLKEILQPVIEKNELQNDL